MSTEPTPRPWAVCEVDPGGTEEIEIVAPNYEWDTIVDGTSLTLANAEHIVRCVNAHDELVRVLDEFEGACSRTSDPLPTAILNVWSDALDVLYKHKLAQFGDGHS